MKPINPADPRSDERVLAQEALGYVAEVDPYFDDVAIGLLKRFGGAFAGVNHMDADRNQFFVGLAVIDEETGEIVVPPADSPFRRMAPDHGFCNYGLVERDLPLPLNDLLSSPRFAGNPVIDILGARAYLGDWLTVPEGLRASTGYTIPEAVKIGSVWVVDTKVQSWTPLDRTDIKAVQAQTMNYIIERDRQRA